MQLKYDIYYYYDQNGFHIIELIPERKEWKIGLTKEQGQEACRFLDSLKVGISQNDAMRTIKDSVLATKLLQLLKQEKMISLLPQNLETPFKRQIEVFDSWNRTERLPQEIQEQLQKSTVFIIGAGGVGTALTNALNSCGVGKIIVADYDRVETSNLARQFLYSTADIGLYKVDVLAEKLNRRGLGQVIPLVEHITAENYLSVVNKVTTEPISVVSGIPFPYKPNPIRLVNQIIGSGTHVMFIGEHDVGPMIDNEDSLRYADDQIDRTFSLQSLTKQYSMQAGKNGFHPSYFPEISITSGLGADQIIRLITGYAPVMVSKAVYSLDPITYQLRRFIL